jgi:hypothetical protein
VGGVNPLSIPCHVGNCRTGPTGDPICALDGRAGDDCTDDRPCALGFVCEASKCLDAHVALGERCTLDGTYVCPDGARCAPAATDGTCVLLKKAGEACDNPDACALGLSCTGGTCQACH